MVTRRGRGGAVPRRDAFLFTARSGEFADPERPVIGADLLAQELAEFEGDPGAHGGACRGKGSGARRAAGPAPGRRAVEVP